MVAEVITFAREVDPLGVTELITHKVEIALTSQTLCEQANHFVKSHTSCHLGVHLLALSQAGVDIGVEEPHGDCLIAYDSLVMRFGIADALLFPAPISHAMRQVAHIPHLIRRVLEQLDPEVRQEHAQSIVETNATVLDCPAESWHPRDIFCDCDRVWHQLLDELASQHEVSNTIEVSLQTEVLMVITRESHVDTMMMVHDTA